MKWVDACWWLVIAVIGSLAGCAGDEPVRQKRAPAVTPRPCLVSEKSPIKEYLRVDGNVVYRGQQELLATINELGEIEGYGKTIRTIGRFEDSRLTYLATPPATSERIHDRVVRLQLGGRSRTFFYSRACRRTQAALGVAALLFKEDEGL
ncbi:MAG: hypothetical protein JXR83_05240 [Deltaproteobacteria bacterium]|nr:hypothetical protein [Deltaproteobacteria bacterium]